MASPSLRQEDLKVLDQTRQRLFQLANNIASLKADVQQGNPLPPWESIQASTAILGNNINSIVEHLQRNSDVLNRTVAYPSPNYPGRTQEGLLGQLLRKKVEPHVETWIEEGRAIQESLGSQDADVDELWAWGKEWVGQRVATYILEEAGDDYTIEEREGGVENVNTGLRRRFEGDESEDEDEIGDGDEKMEDVGVEVTTVGSTATGQVEYGLGELKPRPNAKARSVDDILRSNKDKRKLPTSDALIVVSHLFFIILVTNQTAAELGLLIDLLSSLSL